MKVVLVDNFARETEADILHAEGLSEEEAKRIAKEINDNAMKRGGEPPRWALVKPDDYRLSRGMEDLV